MYNILICDDEKDIVNALKIYLAPEGYGLFEAGDGQEMLRVVEENDIHLILMDIMMPKLDGIAATARLREKYNIPVILLTAKSEDSDKVLGLNIGADDYITKPFNPVEVLARVRSQLRRYTRLGAMPPPKPDHYRFEGLELDDSQKLVTVDGESVSLTGIEYSILLLLMEQPGKVFKSSEIYRSVWKEAPLGSENVVAVHIRHLREKIEIDPSNPRYIKVVWGQGYRLGGNKK